MKLLLRLLAALVLMVVIGVAALLGYVRFALPKVKPAPDLTVVATPEMVERGRYLFHHVAACAECHSAPQITRFSFPFEPGTLGQGGKPFTPAEGLPGYYYAPNITPAALAEWTDGELYRALTVGVDREGEPYFPIMPYHGYARTSDADIKALIAYLRTLPPIENAVPGSKHNFPMNFIVHLMPSDVELAPQPPERSDTVAYGAYLTTMGACADCHTPMIQGKPDFTRSFAGGREFPLPTGGIARSRNISPDHETGIGRWTREMFIARFKSFDLLTYRPPTVVPGEFNTAMPWTYYAGMSTDDLGAIYDFLMTQPPVRSEIVAFTPPAE
ncbi:MAG: cytochrome c [Verrucomicrobiota bacterium JB022]|nr:cytochrome c [Verrucomicrobiota bacterium JB022]